MSGNALFPLDPGHIRPPEPIEELSADRRRTIRQMDALLHGRHPLGLLPGAISLRLHTDAPPAGDRKAPGPRCGTCRFREPTGRGKHSFPKCLRGWDGNPRKDPPFASHGAATDCRTWWPACEYWEPTP